MPFPQTMRELEDGGYRFNGHGRCRGCGEHIEWWFTPEGGRMPFNMMPEADSQPISHFATCPEAERFRKKKDAIGTTVAASSLREAESNEAFVKAHLDQDAKEQDK
jgi:hypothetical protein